MPKNPPATTPENKKLKLKIKNLQKQLQEKKSGEEFWKAKYNISQEWLKKVQSCPCRERERERESKNGNNYVLWACLGIGGVIILGLIAYLLVGKSKKSR